MFIVIQRQIHVDTDVELKVKEYEDTPDDEAQYFSTFIIEHEANSNGTFTVFVSPYSTEQDSIMCEVPSKFTVDFEGLKEIYKDPAKFILDYVVKFDERYEISKDDDDEDDEEVPKVEDRSFDHVDLSRMTTLYEMPMGFTVVQYTNKDGITEDIIAYCTAKRKVTEKDVKLLDLALGAGNYRLLSAKEAKAYIKARDKALNAEEKLARLKKDELEKPEPTEQQSTSNPFDVLFNMFYKNDDK